MTPEQAQFEEENLNDQQLRWLSIVRQIKQTRTMDLQNIRAPIRVTIKSTTTGKGKLYADGCADTGIAAIGNGMVEIYTKYRFFTLVGLMHP